MIALRRYGLASLEQGVAFTPNHVVRHTYSEGREFLAITATLMERDGLLRLDDPVRIGGVGVGECLPGSGVTFIPARAAISRSGMGICGRSYAANAPCATNSAVTRADVWQARDASA